MKRIGNIFNEICTFSNFYKAYKKASRGRKYRVEVMRFSYQLEENLIQLKNDLCSGKYVPQNYYHFTIYEPKKRQICWSHFKDRVVHHAIFNILGPLLDKKFIFDSYACRTGKGTSEAIKRGRFFAKTSLFYLKCDISKYFYSIDLDKLMKIIEQTIKEKELFSILKKIVYHPFPKQVEKKGLPIGNLSSQYFANLYLNNFDHHVKSTLKIKKYIRYMDDFIFFFNDKYQIKFTLNNIETYLLTKLDLKLNKKVVSWGAVSMGIPFLGFRFFPNLIRIQRKKLNRIYKKVLKKEKEYEMGMISETQLANSVQSVWAQMSYASTFQLKKSYLLSKYFKTTLNN